MSFCCSGCRRKNLPAVCFEMFFGVQRKTCLACKAARAKCHTKKVAARTTVAKPTAWTEHIKSFAAKHNISYGCALSLPACSVAYDKAKMLKYCQFVMLQGLENGSFVIMAKTEQEFLREHNAICTTGFRPWVAPIQVLPPIKNESEKLPKSILARAKQEFNAITIIKKPRITKKELKKIETSKFIVMENYG